MPGKLIQFFNTKRTFYIGFILLVLSVLVLYFSYPWEEPFLLAANRDLFVVNVFFINYTFLGDGIFALCLPAYLYFHAKKKNLSLAYLFAFILSGLAIQVIKNLYTVDDPGLFIESGRYMMSHQQQNGYPSGHTATAFAIATVLIHSHKTKKWQLPALLGAALVGYSRIYLAHHDLSEILIGAGIGCFSGMTAYLIIYRNKLYRQPSGYHLQVGV
ncbi:MAG: phosphatase PAP2 family protein [Chitinophagaceae bacterium]|nr:phosphatase PAP2 family protein [Chitinophagaceae bacterium]